jgi:KipI family sensor histidine kinase inhibitor
MVEFGGDIDLFSNALALALAAAVRGDGSTGWGDPVPAYDSVLVPFDPDRLTPDAAAERLEAMLAGLRDRTAAHTPGRLHAIPVRYGGADGPDLVAVAERLGLSPAHVVEAHAAETYRVFMLGFAPGFAYLGPLPEVLRLPRREDPRPRVPIGSVAISGPQTAVYPVSTAGGWHLIGRTDTVIWDARRAAPALLMPGDMVRFEPVA